ncbi:HTH-type transcriptional regulator PgrR [Burkholderiales bacterium]|nr:HTH-type transcriptional regulator PgrR [Burkholderiales bacterium]
MVPMYGASGSRGSHDFGYHRSMPGTIAQSKELDANDLLLFARVIEAGSFSRAAERLGLPKSTLSRRIAALETLLGEKLMQRSTRRLAITDFGEAVLDHARRLTEETEATLALAQHRQAKPQGTLRVSLPPNLLDIDHEGVIATFVERHPQVRLELDLSPRRVDLLAERFDLALRAATALPDDSTLVARRLVDLPVGLFASPVYLKCRGQPATPEALLQHRALHLLGSQGKAGVWSLHKAKRVWQGLPAGPVAANSMALLRNLAVQGLGIAALTLRDATTAVQQKQLQRVLPAWSLPAVTLWCVTPGRRLLPARTRAFLAVLQELLGVAR